MNKCATGKWTELEISALAHSVADGCRLMSSHAKYVGTRWGKQIDTRLRATFKHVSIPTYEFTSQELEAPPKKHRKLTGLVNNGGARNSDVAATLKVSLALIPVTDLPVFRGPTADELLAADALASLASPPVWV